MNTGLIIKVLKVGVFLRGINPKWLACRKKLPEKCFAWRTKHLGEQVTVRRERKIMAEKIQRQALTWRHVGDCCYHDACAAFGCQVSCFVAAGLCISSCCSTLWTYRYLTFRCTLLVTYIGSAIAPIPASWLFDRVNSETAVHRLQPLWYSCLISVFSTYILQSGCFWIQLVFILGLGLASSRIHL